MTIFGASIGVIMCFFRQTLLSVCLAVPLAVWGQPNADNDIASTLEDVDVIFNITANDDDASFGIDHTTVDLDPSTPASIENSISITEGDFNVDPTGLLSFSPAPEFSGDAIISYTVKNLNSSPETSNIATVTVTVNAVNDVPTITAIGDQTIDEDTPTNVIDFTIGDVETDPSLLTLAPLSDNQALVPESNIVFGGSSTSRNVQITPAADLNGTVNITITVSDGSDNASISFEVTVTPVNDAPTITSISDQVIDQDGQTGLLGFTVGDLESTPSSLTVTGLSSNTTLVPDVDIDIVGTGSNKTVQVSPAAGQFGVATITLRVSDGPNVTETSFVLTVTQAANNPPTITAITDQVIDEDNSTGGLTFTIDDVETAVGDLMVTKSSDNQTLIPDGNVLLAGTGAVRTVTVTPLSNLSGTANITITVDDGQAIDQTTFSVTVNAVNDVPVITSISTQSIIEDSQTGALSFNISDVETTPDMLSVDKASSNPGLVPDANIVLAGNGASRTVNIIPVANQSGSTNITLTVDDGTDSTPMVFQVFVTSVNDFPTITSVPDQVILENTPTGALAVTIGDVETSAGSLTLSGSSDNDSLIPDANIIEGGSGANRTVTITPALNQSGVATITLAVNDGTNTTETEFEITVNAVNDPPTITSIANQTIPEDSQTGPLAFTIGDPETPSTMLLLTPTSSNIGLVPTNQVVLGGVGSLRNVNVIPNINQIGLTTITLEVSDGLLSTTTSFNVLVTALDDPPTITPIGDQITNEDTPTGLIPFTVGDLETDPTLITVTGTSDNQLIVQDGDIDLQGFGSADRTVQITPNPNANGTATITLTVSDGTETTILEFDLTVNAVNDVPSFTGGANQTDTEDAGPRSVSSWATGINDGDPELAQTLTFNVSNNNTALFTLAGQPAISATGELTYTPAPNANGAALVTVSLSDNGSGVSPNVNESPDQTFTITVTAVNDAPSFTKGADQTVVENSGSQSVPGWATGMNDGDPELNQILSFNVTNNNTSLFTPGGQPAISGGGALSFTPEPGANGSATVTVSLSDNGSGVAPNVNTSPQQTFIITVTPINAAPVFTKGPDQTINEDAGAQSVSPWATGIDDGDPEVGQSLTFNVTNNNTTLFTTQPTISASGDLTYTPALNANGSAVVTVTLSDDGSDVPPSVNTSAAQTFNITINAINDAPFFTGGGNVTVSENSGLQSFAWATGMNDGDAESSQTLSFNVSNNNTGLFQTQPAISPAGNLTFTPQPGFSGSATVTVTLSDNGSGIAPNVNTSGPQVFTITVTQINDAPVFTKGADQTINEDAGAQTVNGWATGINDGDPDQTQTLTFNVTNDNNTLFSAQPTITPAGHLSYTPAPNAAGSAIVTVTLSDDGPGSPPDVNTSAPQTFTILINPQNDAPAVSVIGNQTINEDTQTGNIAFTISDPETAATDLTVGATSDNTALVPNNVANIVLGGAGPSRTINIIPVSNQFGSATITVTVSDGSLSANRNFLVTVTSVNDPPTITPIGDQNIVEDTSTGALAFTIGDVETPILEVTRSSSNTVLVPLANAVLGGSGNDRTITVTPANNQTGSSTITVTVNDGTATTSINFVVNVSPVNDPPSISTITNRTINEDSQTGNISFTVGDPETAAGALNVTGASSNTTLVPDANIVLGGTGATRTVNVIPAGNQFGTVDITLNVSDNLNSTPMTFQVTVTPVNDAPLITNQIPVTVNEMQPTTLTLSHLTVVDPDNVYPADFSLSVTGGVNYSISGTHTVTPDPNFSGVLSVPVFVGDGSAFSPIYQFQITVNSTNDAPQITAQKTTTILEDQNYSLQFDDLTVVDLDNDYPDDFTLEILAGTNYNFTSTTITPTPPNFNGSISVNVRVNDGQLNSNTFPFVIGITAVNDPPAITNQSPLSTNEETPITLVVGNFTITDPEPTTYTLTVLPSASPNYTVDGNKVTPSLDFTGTLSVPVTVSDGALSSAQYNAQITVNPVNDAPQILNQTTSLSTIEDIPITLMLSHLNVSDVDNAYPTGFSLAVAAGANYTFSGPTVTPNLDYVGTLYVVVTVNDGVANSPQFLVEIEVTDDADAPVITGQNPVAFDEDTSREITIADLKTEDPDTPENQRTVILQQGTNYTLEGNIIHPLPNFFGVLTVGVIINDGEANSNLFQMQVTVNSVNDKPTFNQPANVTINEDAAQQSITITGISPGPLEAGQSLAPSATSDNTSLIPQPQFIPMYNGTAPTATLVFTPVPNMYGTATITVNFIDQGFLGDPKTFTITVNPINDAPTLQPIADVTIIEDSPEQIISLAGLSPGGGTLESTQTLTVVPSADNPQLLETIQPIEISGSTGTLRLTPKPNAFGTIQVTVKVTDDGPSSPPNVNFINRSFILTIDPVNDLPAFSTNPALTAEPGVLYQYDVDVTDADGETLTLTAPTLPSWLTFTPGANGKATLSGTPPPGTSGDAPVLLQAKDPTGQPVGLPFTIVVNSRPVLTNITTTMNEDQSHTFTSAEFEAGYVDADGHPIGEIQITELPNGTLTFNNQAVTVGQKIAYADISKLVYTPIPNSINQDTLSWTASDALDLYSTNDSYVILKITPLNDIPVINIPESDVAETDTLKYELGSEIPVFVSTQFEAVDPDGDNITSAEIGFKRIDNFQYRPENDRLIFTSTSKITGEFKEDAGVLRLTGSATAQEYQEAIRSITYNYVDTRELLLDTRSVYVQISDGQSQSLQESRIITLIYTFSDLDIPNAFSPNGDTANETWKITSANGTAQYDDAEVKVYNKRGLLLFETRGFERQWDGVWNGEVLPSDTYFYTIELNYNKVRYKGTVTILR